MRPAGRLQAAIEILENHATGTRPVRLVLSSWARSNRYAGSKDRAAIANLVFDVLRRSRSYGIYMGDASPRSLALAAFLDGWGGELSELDEVCDGDRHAPAPLSTRERVGLSRLASATPPNADPASLADIPTWIFTSVERAFGERTIAEGQGLARRAPIDLRVNRLKVKPSTLTKALVDLEIESPAGFENALRISPPQGAQKSPRLEGLDVYERGWFELQDLGSQIVSMMTGVKAGMQVLDLCAGSGGKTLALAALMENKGQIHAYDVEPKRLAPIAQRLQRGGVHNVRVLPANNEGVLDKLTGKMDVVLVDAPCSGSGTWRRKPDSKWRLTKEQIEQRLEEQKQVLQQGREAVKAGGRLVYVTCSILPEENGDQIEAFLAAHGEFTLVPYAKVWRETGAKTELVSALPDENCLQLTPANNECDGFFVAVMQKS